MTPAGGMGEWGHWLAGLIDGEGCFRIQRIKGRPGGTPRYNPTFALKLRDDDEPILREVIAKTGLGHLGRDEARSGGSQPCSIWRIDSIPDCAALCALLEEFPLRTRKARDLVIWRQAVEWKQETPRGNRWHGARDWAPMAEFQTALASGRAYVGGR